MAAALIGTGTLARPASGQCSYELDGITNAVNQFLTNVPTIRGVVVRVQRGGVLIYERAFGVYTLETVVPIASASKWPTGALLMSLIDDGTIGLDDPLAMYLPSYNEPGLDQITIRMGHAHTSGLPANNTGGLDDCNPCLNDRTTTLQACAAAIAAEGLRTDAGGVPVTPGSEFGYGGCSMQAAGAAAEVAAATPYVTLFDERIREPLGMTSMTFGVGANPRVGGGLSSNARDYARFLQMILQSGRWNGQSVLTPESARVLIQDQTNDVPIYYSPPVAVDAGFVGYGVGNWTNTQGPDGETIQCSSEGAFGFSPWVDIRRGALGVFLVQDQNQRVRPLVEQIQALVRAAVDRSHDVDGSSAVDFGDITTILSNFGRSSMIGDPQGPGPIGDISGNGVVDFGDVTRVLLRWGDSCP